MAINLSAVRSPQSTSAVHPFSSNGASRACKQSPRPSTNFEGTIMVMASGVGGGWQMRRDGVRSH